MPGTNDQVWFVWQYLTVEDWGGMNEYSNGASLTIDDDNCEEELYFIFVMTEQWHTVAVEAEW